MKSLKFLFIALLAFSFVNIVNAAEKKAAPAKTAKPAAKKPIEGTVVSLENILAGKDVVLTKDQAVEVVKNHGTLLLQVGKGKSAKLYFVNNPDGTVASKKLAVVAGGTTTVLGAVQTMAGINVITSDVIEAKK
jgi:hypothetical protein